MAPTYCSTDLHYSQTFVPETDQSNATVLQAIKDSQCSPVFEKYLCYTTVPPCKPYDLSVYVPCRSVCEQVGLYICQTYTCKDLGYTSFNVQKFWRVVKYFKMSSSNREILLGEIIVILFLHGFPSYFSFQ